MPARAATAQTTEGSPGSFPWAAAAPRRATPSSAATAGSWRSPQAGCANGRPSAPLQAGRPARHRCAPQPRRRPADHAASPPSGLYRIEDAAAGIVHAANFLQSLGIQHIGVAGAVAGIDLRIGILADGDVEQLILETVRQGMAADQPVRV